MAARLPFVGKAERERAEVLVPSEDAGDKPRATDPVHGVYEMFARGADTISPAAARETAYQQMMHQQVAALLPTCRALHGLRGTFRNVHLGVDQAGCSPFQARKLHAFFFVLESWFAEEKQASALLAAHRSIEPLMLATIETMPPAETGEMLRVVNMAHLDAHLADVRAELVALTERFMDLGDGAYERAQAGWTQLRAYLANERDDIAAAVLPPDSIGQWEPFAEYLALFATYKKAQVLGVLHARDGIKRHRLRCLRLAHAAHAMGRVLFDDKYGPPAAIDGRVPPELAALDVDALVDAEPTEADVKAVEAWFERLPQAEQETCSDADRTLSDMLKATLGTLGATEGPLFELSRGLAEALDAFDECAPEIATARRTYTRQTFPSLASLSDDELDALHARAQKEGWTPAPDVTPEDALLSEAGLRELLIHAGYQGSVGGVSVTGVPGVLRNLWRALMSPFETATATPARRAACKCIVPFVLAASITGVILSMPQQFLPSTLTVEQQRASVTNNVIVSSGNASIVLNDQYNLDDTTHNYIDASSLHKTLNFPTDSVFEDRPLGPSVGATVTHYAPDGAIKLALAHTLNTWRDVAGMAGDAAFRMGSESLFSHVWGLSDSIKYGAGSLTLWTQVYYFYLHGIDNWSLVLNTVKGVLGVLGMETDPGTVDGLSKDTYDRYMSCLKWLADDDITKTGEVAGKPGVYQITIRKTGQNLWWTSALFVLAAGGTFIASVASTATGLLGLAGLKAAVGPAAATFASGLWSAVVSNTPVLVTAVAAPVLKMLKAVWDFTAANVRFEGLELPVIDRLHPTLSYPIHFIFRRLASVSPGIEGPAVHYLRGFIVSRIVERTGWWWLAAVFDKLTELQSFSMFARMRITQQQTNMRGSAFLLRLGLMYWVGFEHQVFLWGAEALGLFFKFLLDGYYAHEGRVNHAPYEAVGLEGVGAFIVAEVEKNNRMITSQSRAQPATTAAVCDRMKDALRKFATQPTEPKTFEELTAMAKDVLKYHALDGVAPAAPGYSGWISASMGFAAPVVDFVNKHKLHINLSAPRWNEQQKFADIEAVQRNIWPFFRAAAAGSIARALRRYGAEPGSGQLFRYYFRGVDEGNEQGRPAWHYNADVNVPAAPAVPAFHTSGIIGDLDPEDMDPTIPDPAARRAALFTARRQRLITRFRSAGLVPVGPEVPRSDATPLDPWQAAIEADVRAHLGLSSGGGQQIPFLGRDWFRRTFTEAVTTQYRCAAIIGEGTAILTPADISALCRNLPGMNAQQTASLTSHMQAEVRTLFVKQVYFYVRPEHISFYPDGRGYDIPFIRLPAYNQLVKRWEINQRPHPAAATPWKEAAAAHTTYQSSGSRQDEYYTQPSCAVEFAELIETLLVSAFCDWVWSAWRRFEQTDPANPHLKVVVTHRALTDAFVLRVRASNVRVPRFYEPYRITWRVDDERTDVIPLVYGPLYIGV